MNKTIILWILILGPATATADTPLPEATIAVTGSKHVVAGRNNKACPAFEVIGKRDLLWRTLFRLREGASVSSRNWAIRRLERKVLRRARSVCRGWGGSRSKKRSRRKGSRLTPNKGAVVNYCVLIEHPYLVKDHGRRVYLDTCFNVVY